MFSSVARREMPMDSNTLQMREQLEGVAPQAVGADHPDLGEAANTPHHAQARGQPADLRKGWCLRRHRPRNA